MRLIRSTSDTKSASSLWSLWTLTVAQTAAAAFLALVAFSIISAVFATRAEARINMIPTTSDDNDWGIATGTHPRLSTTPPAAACLFDCPM